MKILGIDPGTATTGFGLIEKDGQKLTKLDYGVISTPKTSPMPERLQMLYEDLTEIVKSHKPDSVAVEKLFFTNNITTAMSVSQARGVVLLVAQQQKLSIAEYTPLQVKMSVTGYGQAQKKQVQEMVKRILKLTVIPKPDDAADALAIAICHSANKLANWLGISFYLCFKQMDHTALIVLYTLCLPAAVVFGAVFLATHSSRKNASLLHDIVLAAVLVSAAIAGLIALFNIPTKLMMLTSDNLIFAVRVFIGVAMVLIGLFLPNKIQKYFLMALGLFMLIVELPFVFTNFGSYGALLIVGIAFLALVGVTIWLTTRGKKHEQSS